MENYLLHHSKENPIRNRFYFLSAFLGMLAGNMFNYSIIILSHHLAKDESFAGTIFFLAYLPFLIFSIPAGYFLDHYSKKYIIATTQFFSFAAAFTPGILYIYENLNSTNKELLYIFVVLNGISLSFTMPGRFAILGDLLGSDKVPKYTILMNIFMLIGFAIAPILSGFILEFKSYGHLLVLTGIVFLTSSLIVFSLDIPKEKFHKHQHKLQAFHETFSIIQKTNILKESLVLIFIAMIVVGPIQVLVPEYSLKVLKYSEFKRGLLLGFLGLGLIFGSTSSYIVSKYFSKGKLSLLSVPISAFFVGLIGIKGYFISSQEFQSWMDDLLIFLSLFITGYFTGLLLSYIPSMIQESISNLFRGRVMSIYSLIFLLTPAIFGLIYGKISTQYTITDAVVLSGVVNLLLGVFAYFYFKTLREHK